MGKIVTIWDGEQFVHVDQAKAKKLVKADKAQILSGGLVDGLSLKYRNQFTGYKTRELRAEKVAPVAPEPEPEAEVAPDYAAHTVAELKELMSERGIKFKSSMKKADLVAALEASDG